MERTEEGVEMFLDTEAIEALEEISTSLGCPICDLLRINGRIAHEFGCPEAWRTETRECSWCGSPFKPESKLQHYCSDSCYALVLGEPEFAEEGAA